MADLQLVRPAHDDPVVAGGMLGGRALKECKVDIVRRLDKSLRTVETAGALDAVKALRTELLGG